MSYITLKCKNCGANMSLNTESHSATCNHCGNTFLLSEILDEKDIAFISKLSPQNLEQKMMANDALKHGETLLFQNEFEKAESYFKKAIELDDTNYKGYIGVVKAKTQNFNKLPDEDDYLQYAHYALSLATGDDLVLVKSELSKIDLLEYEKRKQKKNLSSNRNGKENIKNHKREVANVFTIITIFIILMFGAFFFINSMFTDMFFGGSKKNPSINIDSYETFTKVFSNDKYLNYDINLTADIDCNGNTLTPFGTPTSAFTGSFNGNNHKISNATITPTNENYVGIFGYTVLADIKNLVLERISLNVNLTPENSSSSFYGLLVAKSEASTITNIEIKNNCELSVIRNIDYPTAIGGLIGTAINASFISNISSHAKLNVNLSQNTNPTNSYIGGIVGNCQNSVIEKTCSNSSIYSNISNTSFSSSKIFVSGIIGSVINPSSIDVLNINHNFFSGIVSLNSSSNVVSVLSGIASSNLKSTTLLSNACLYTSRNFILNSLNISYASLNDYTQNEYFVDFCTANDIYLSKLSNIFLSWTNTNTFEPSLTA